MHILVNDVMQFASTTSIMAQAFNTLRTPSLADSVNLAAPGGTGMVLDLSFSIPSLIINCIGLGNFNAETIGIELSGALGGGDGSFEFRVEGRHRNGLYMFPRAFFVTPGSRFRIIARRHIVETITFGRIALGEAIDIPTSVRKEPSFNTTATPRTTLSGSVLPGRGGYNFRGVSLDSRYKITERIMRQFEDGYPFIAQGFPFFINFETEAYKLPFDRLYAIDTNRQNFGFESGVRDFLYSRRWNFEERF